MDFNEMVAQVIREDFRRYEDVALGVWMFGDPAPCAGHGRVRGRSYLCACACVAPVIVDRS